MIVVQNKLILLICLFIGLLFLTRLFLCYNSINNPPILTSLYFITGLRVKSYCFICIILTIIIFYPLLSYIAIGLFYGKNIPLNKEQVSVKFKMFILSLLLFYTSICLCHSAIGTIKLKIAINRNDEPLLLTSELINLHANCSMLSQLFSLSLKVPFVLYFCETVLLCKYSIEIQMGIYTKISNFLIYLFVVAIYSCFFDLIYDIKYLNSLKEVYGVIYKDNGSSLITSLMLSIAYMIVYLTLLYFQIFENF